MLLAQKVATVLALATLAKSSKTRASLAEQADATLALMAEGQSPLATATIDAAASEGLHALKREGWTSESIARAVERELRNARVVPTVKGRAFG
jgi:hypothetical protein